jgi:ubiquinone/menaquinone biosynthesis C-methylase UbiE
MSNIRRGVSWSREFDMTTTKDQRQKELVQDRFTRTAEVFGDFAVRERVREAEHLAELVRASARDRALDLCCGPGTLALRFARHVRWIVGLDFTPAILHRARRSAETEDLPNLFLTLGDARALPFANGSIDLAVTSYSLHHIPDPANVIREMARVLAPGGRAGVLDMIVPEAPQAAVLRNRIEVARDPSHARALPKSGLETMFAVAGLRVLASEIDSKPRSFDHWLSVAGWKRGDAAYVEARALLEESMRAGEDSGFYPRFLPVDRQASDAMPDIELTQSSLFIVGEKE